MPNLNPHIRAFLDELQSLESPPERDIIAAHFEKHMFAILDERDKAVIAEVRQIITSFEQSFSRGRA